MQLKICDNVVIGDFWNFNTTHWLWVNAKLNKKDKKKLRRYYSLVFPRKFVEDMIKDY